MFVTLLLVFMSAQYESLKPEVLYVGTVWIDLFIVESLYHLLG